MEDVDEFGLGFQEDARRATVDENSAHFDEPRQGCEGACGHDVDVFQRRQNILDTAVVDRCRGTTGARSLTQEGTFARIGLDQMHLRSGPPHE